MGFVYEIRKGMHKGNVWISVAFLHGILMDL